MFNKEECIRKVTAKSHLRDNEVECFLKFFLGEKYEISVPNNLTERKACNNKIILELPSSINSAYIVPGSNFFDVSMELFIYENSQDSERLVKSITLYLDEKKGFSRTIIRVADYREDGSVIYSEINSKYNQFNISLRISSDYYNISTCEFIGEDIKDVYRFNQFESYDIQPDERNSYEGEYGCLKSQWIPYILEKYSIVKQELIDKVNANVNLTLRGE